MKIKSGDGYYFEGFVTALAIILVVISAMWYYQTLEDERASALAVIEELTEPCHDMARLTTTCDLAEESYSLTFDGVCGKELRRALRDIEEDITNEMSLISLRKMARLEPLSVIEILNGEPITLGEIYTGMDYYARVQKMKLDELFETNALKLPCEMNNALMLEYAMCDMRNVRLTLPGEARSISGAYMEYAEQYYRAGEYLKAISYSTAAVAYQDQFTRDAYYELIAAEGRICLE